MSVYTASVDVGNMVTTRVSVGIPGLIAIECSLGESEAVCHCSCLTRTIVSESDLLVKIPRDAAEEIVTRTWKKNSRDDGGKCRSTVQPESIEELFY